MPKRRRRYKRGKLKFKLKKNTIYSIFSFGLILSGILLFVSFTKSQPSLIVLSDQIEKYFGGTGFLLALSLVFFGFLFLRLKMFISRPNVAIGFSLFFICVDALFRGGLIGDYLFRTISDIVTDFGADIA